MCRDADGNLIVHQPQVLERQKEYFMKMFIVAETDQISDIMDDLVGDNDLYIESNYNIPTNSCTLLPTTAHAKPSQYAMFSLVIAW
jgi:hypothetical protein